MKANLMPAGMKKLDPDGKFGPLTQAAVREFQTYKGLTIDGIAGPETSSASIPMRFTAFRRTSVGRRRGPVGTGRDAPRRTPARRSPCRSSGTTSSSSRSLSISAPSCRRRFLRLYRRRIRRQKTVRRVPTERRFTHNVPLLGSSTTPSIR